MTRIIYNRGRHTLTASGHAGGGEKGNDLICAAASILALTLGENVERLAEAKLVGAGFTVDIRDGRAKISCTPTSGWENVVEAVFQAVIAGYEVLAQRFPENISFKMIH